jgi:hypothetical protein
LTDETLFSLLRPSSKRRITFSQQEDNKGETSGANQGTQHPCQHVISPPLVLPSSYPSYPSSLLVIKLYKANCVIITIKCNVMNNTSKTFAFNATDLNLPSSTTVARSLHKAAPSLLQPQTVSLMSFSMQPATAASTPPPAETAYHAQIGPLEAQIASLLTMLSHAVKLLHEAIASCNRQFEQLATAIYKVCQLKSISIPSLPTQQQLDEAQTLAELATMSQTHLVEC